MKGNQLMESEMLAQRITEDYNDVFLSHLVSITQYSKRHFESCLKKSPYLNKMFQLKFKGCFKLSSNFALFYFRFESRHTILTNKNA